MKEQIKSILFPGAFFVSVFLQGITVAQSLTTKRVLPDVQKWERKKEDVSFFKDHKLSGKQALDYWMQSANFRGNPDGEFRHYSRFERLQKGDARQVAQVNSEIQRECKKTVAETKAGRQPPHRQSIVWMELALRVPEKLTPETHQVIRESISALNIAEKKSYYMGWMGTPGSNGSNVHAYLTPLVLAPALIDDPAIFAAGKKGLISELDHMNSTGDVAEFNLLESHWNGTASWEIHKQFIADAHLKRMSRMISERLWINRFLTWSPVVERITGPGSRMAPSEWLGTDNERALFATGLSKPIWLNFFFPWDGWDPKSVRQSWEQTQLEATVPDLSPYLQDLAWNKTFPNELQARIAFKHWKPYPELKGVVSGNPLRPAKYVNYQTSKYTLGSTTSSWVVNTCVVSAAAWWNNSRNPNAPVGSPERFCVLYPHYVFNGMSFLDKGEMYYADAPDKMVSDSKGGPGGPWMREFIDFGRVGTIQDRNTLLLSYTAKPGTHHKGQDLVKTKTQRASAAMFLFRWTGTTEGLFVNRQPIKNLPHELKPGDWWFIEDGDVYAAVRPLNATCLKGNCRTVLEKKKRHVVLYQDNVNAENIEGITDEDWVKAQSGFIVEMGDKNEYKSFAQFQDRILNGKVTNDQRQDFNRFVSYARDDRKLEMNWNCYSEEYQTRKVGGKADPWPEFLISPEFSVDNSGVVKVPDATLKTVPGQTAWLLSAKTSGHWVAYQANPDKTLPVDFTSPVGRVVVDQFPFGKIDMHKITGESLQIRVDASYTDLGSISKYWKVYTTEHTKTVLVTINGNAFRCRNVKRGENLEWFITNTVSDSK